MLKAMRKHAKFFYILFFLVILSFIVWGVGTVDKSTSVSVAEIGKEKITVEEYWRAYERVRNAYREIYKGQFNEEMEKNLNLKEMVLNSLVQEKVLLIAAGELGITVTDKELQDAIMRDPRFVREGVFRKDVYFRTLDLNRLTPEMFEASLRQEGTLMKMRNLIWSVVDVPSSEAAGLDDARRQMLLQQKRNVALRSYVEDLKSRMKAKVNTEIIS